mmetsp:Transcript_6157/g.17581  ORF Transcript_6157/g.17581 Transcript_6157/m.17581 type:complete len:489 (-) Transcript_6157:104-1570(-)
MDRQPFESAAAEIVSESEHPLEQLRQLEAKAWDLRQLGDADAVVECRIKQLSLQKVLVHLYGFPTTGLVEAQTALADAYAVGGYSEQAQEHLKLARVVCEGSVHDDEPSRRLEVGLALVQGVVSFELALRLTSQGERARAEATATAATRSLLEASRLAREAFGSKAAEYARASELLGRLASRAGRHYEAAGHFRDALRAQEAEGSDTEDASPRGDGDDAAPCNLSARAEAAVTARLRLAEALFECGANGKEEAIVEQRKAVDALRAPGAGGALLVGALAQLARWVEHKGRDHDKEALALFLEAEEVLNESLDATCGEGRIGAAGEAVAATPMAAGAGRGGAPLADMRERLREIHMEKLDAAGDPERLMRLEIEESSSKRLMEASRAQVLKAVELKREIALIYLQLDRCDDSLQYLQHCEYLERWLHGSQSTNVGKILKALGTVHLTMQNVEQAEQCLRQALRIFEADHPPNTAVIRDIRAKLNIVGDG